MAVLASSWVSRSCINCACRRSLCSLLILVVLKCSSRKKNPSFMCETCGLHQFKDSIKSFFIFYFSWLLLTIVVIIVFVVVMCKVGSIICIWWLIYQGFEMWFWKQIGAWMCCVDLHWISHQTCIKSDLSYTRTYKY